ncbi:SirB2 family protein [Alkalilimnicola sp. S0819]|uniref:SirB2 family protein n=1 Tax=Alkalilimnicola sp. S0819 TaxID=2613922 RepID=UPI0012624526|nr:SirB2 family protein [Alkalilimnicola sp. S0819]KAB7624418.1 SirB2 family protein [Alkalilimnicola sp. S0819]MPQ16248.1 regulator SirB [Alkalilimnicola sp. S0819]
MYAALKHIHLLAVVLSIALFLFRGVLMLLGSRLLRARVLRVLPHGVDTVLLISALALAWQFYRWPAVGHDWIHAKLIALVCYIVLGTVALKRGRTLRGRALALVGALVVFAYIVMVALSKQVWPF